MVLEQLRIIPDWPRPGIQFLDINSALTSPECFGEIVQWLRDCCYIRQATSIVAIESRGFVFGAPVAAMMGIPLVLARKADRLPGSVVSVDYETEYSQDRLCLQTSAPVGLAPMIIDDVLATGGTLTAVGKLLRTNFDVKTVSAATVIGLSFLDGQEACGQHNLSLDVMEWYHG
jgi:adenine phosphoribosyltransferase